MSIKQAAWVHGNIVALESPSWRAFPQGPGATVTPYNESTVGWCHFAIPTPVILDGKRLRAGSAMARLQTGPGAKIIGFHVWDGDKRIAAYDNLNVTVSTPNMLRYDVPDRPEVLWGTVICVLVQFSGNVADNWVKMIGAGIDFFN